MISVQYKHNTKGRRFLKPLDFHHYYSNLKSVFSWFWMPKCIVFQIFTCNFLVYTSIMLVSLVQKINIYTHSFYFFKNNAFNIMIIMLAWVVILTFWKWFWRTVNSSIGAIAYAMPYSSDMTWFISLIKCDLQTSASWSHAEITFPNIAQTLRVKIAIEQTFPNLYQGLIHYATWFR